MGDELRLRLTRGDGSQWIGVGHVIKIPDSKRTCRSSSKTRSFIETRFVSDFGEDVGIELKSNAGVPENVTHGFNADFVWKATSFDR